jgi:hypothetical protein
MKESTLQKCGQYLEEYLENKSIASIVKKYNISQNTFTTFLKMNGIEIINYQNLSNVDENVFEKVDTEEKAYWLGFMYKDSTIFLNRKFDRYKKATECRIK